MDKNSNYVSDTDPNGARIGISQPFDMHTAHEMTHAILLATIDNYRSLPNYFDEGIAELTVGRDRAISQFNELFNGPSLLAYELQDSVNESSSAPQYTAGYMLWRYFAKQANIIQPKGTTVNGDTITLDNSFYSQLYLNGANLFSGEETYKNDDIVNIDATSTTNNTILVGNNQNNRIKAGSGETTMWCSSQGNDTLVGGSGKDTFLYFKNNGNDTIEKISSKDALNLSDMEPTEISGVNMNGNNVALTFTDGGSLNIVNGKNAWKLTTNIQATNVDKTYNALILGDDSAFKADDDISKVDVFMGKILNLGESIKKTKITLGKDFGTTSAFTDDAAYYKGVTKVVGSSVAASFIIGDLGDTAVEICGMANGDSLYAGGSTQDNTVSSAAHKRTYVGTSGNSGRAHIDISDAANG